MKRRNVIYQKWIPTKYEKGQSWPPITGTNTYENGFNTNGFFLQFVIVGVDKGGYSINQTMALIENIDGTIEEVHISRFKFLSI